MSVRDNLNEQDEEQTYIYYTLVSHPALSACQKYDGVENLHHSKDIIKNSQHLRTSTELGISTFSFL